MLLFRLPKLLTESVAAAPSFWCCGDWLVVIWPLEAVCRWTVVAVDLGPPPTPSELSATVRC